MGIIGITSKGFMGITLVIIPYQVCGWWQTGIAFPPALVFVSGRFGWWMRTFTHWDHPCWWTCTPYHPATSHQLAFLQATIWGPSWWFQGRSGSTPQDRRSRWLCCWSGSFWKWSWLSSSYRSLRLCLAVWFPSVVNWFVCWAFQALCDSPALDSFARISGCLFGISLFLWIDWVSSTFTTILLSLSWAYSIFHWLNDTVRLSSPIFLPRF